MFRKKCNECGEKVNNNFDFCPYCGADLTNPKDYGMLGKKDLEEKKDFFNNQMPGFGFFDKMIGTTLRMLQNEMQKEIGGIRKIEPRINALPKTNLQVYVNGRKVNFGDMHFKEKENIPKKLVLQKKINKFPVPSEKILAESKNLPRKEAKSTLKRLANKVIYEILVPGITSLDRILITPVEDSIEIKAYTKKAVYHKNLPVKLPLIQYSIKEKGKLVLEFKA